MSKYGHLCINPLQHYLTSSNENLRINSTANFRSFTFAEGKNEEVLTTSHVIHVLTPSNNI